MNENKRIIPFITSRIVVDLLYNFDERYRRNAVYDLNQLMENTLNSIRRKKFLEVKDEVINPYKSRDQHYNELYKVVNEYTKRMGINELSGNYFNSVDLVDKKTLESFPFTKDGKVERVYAEMVNDGVVTINYKININNSLTVILMDYFTVETLDDLLRTFNKVTDVLYYNNNSTHIMKIQDSYDQDKNCFPYVLKEFLSLTFEGYGSSPSRLFMSKHDYKSIFGYYNAILFELMDKSSKMVEVLHSKTKNYRSDDYIKRWSINDIDKNLKYYLAEF